jgi:pyridoxal phosphate enzyme (YggS family)
MPLDSIASRLEHIKEQMSGAAETAGRSGEDVTLIAVSKGVDTRRISEAITAGHVDFGENRAQEAAAKHAELCEQPIRWHFVGRLQRNKVKSIAEFVHMIHSVDRNELAEEIAQRSAPTTREEGKTRVLIEVNTSGEQAKGGVDPAELPALVEKVASLDRLEVKGLMTMAPIVEDAEAARPYFRLLARLRDDMQGKFPNAGIQHLSMGMSQDYLVAIEEGATLVRIGQAIFGPRLPRSANPSG